MYFKNTNIDKVVWESQLEEDDRLTQLLFGNF